MIFSAVRQTLVKAVCKSLNTSGSSIHQATEITVTEKVKSMMKCYSAPAEIALTDLEASNEKLSVAICPNEYQAERKCPVGEQTFL